MQELIKINYDTEQPTVSARELHKKLNIETPFKKWIDRMCEYRFEESKDFWTKMSESTGFSSNRCDRTVRTIVREMEDQNERGEVEKMQRRRLRKLRWLREGCMTSGVIGFLILASIPDNLPGRMILTRAVIALLVMALSWITYRYAQCMEHRYIRIHKRQQEKKKSA